MNLSQFTHMIQLVYAITSSESHQLKCIETYRHNYDIKIAD